MAYLALLLVSCGIMLDIVQFEVSAGRCDAPVPEWTIEKQSSHPSARSGAITAKTANGDLWMFGGWGTNGTLNDLWMLQSGSRKWLKKDDVKSPIPLSRFTGHACCFNKKFVIFGGQSETKFVFNDVWVYDTEHSYWEEINFNGSVPKPRAFSASWCVESQMLIFGGYDTNVEVPYDDIWILQLAGSLKWIQIETDIKPTARYGASTWVGKNGTMYLFGGITYVNKPEPKYLENDMWMFDADSHEFKQLLESWFGKNYNVTVGYYGDMEKGDFVGQPGGRAMSASWADDCGHLWLFSGQGLGEKDDSFGIQSDLWYYMPSDNVWISSGGFQDTNVAPDAQHYGKANIDNFPGSRWMCASWTVKNDMYLFGGNSYDDESSRLNDLWRLTWQSLSYYHKTKVTPTKAPSIYMWTFLTGGVVVFVLISLAVIRKCFCVKKEEKKKRHAKVKYQKLNNEDV